MGRRAALSAPRCHSIVLQVVLDSAARAFGRQAKQHHGLEAAVFDQYASTSRTAGRARGVRRTARAEAKAKERAKRTGHLALHPGLHEGEVCILAVPAIVIGLIPNALV